MPLCTKKEEAETEPLSLIVPARNEERTLPILLQSVVQAEKRPTEILVVDDASTDSTAAIARSFGATVISAGVLPAGWTGKTWACSQGFERAAADWFLFLDADTYFASEGLARIASAHQAMGDGSIALSVLPYHETKEPYEELSLFFHLMMAMGAGGFGWLGRPRLFGQSLLIERDLYKECGGHFAVRNAILENFSLAAKIESAGGRCVCLGGRGVLNIRMFPGGLRQLCEGWVKAFAVGAAACEPAVLAGSIFWLTTLCTTFLELLLAPSARLLFASLYTAFVLQLYWTARQIGTYRLWTCVFYPLPLVFYFVLFGRSMYYRVFKRTVRWRGRSV
jgi:4,4'-diaponeurosporenoate glycosyltransferase